MLSSNDTVPNLNQPLSLPLIWSEFFVELEDTVKEAFEVFLIDIQYLEGPIEH